MKNTLPINNNLLNVQTDAVLLRIALALVSEIRAERWNDDQSNDSRVRVLALKQALAMVLVGNLDALDHADNFIATHADHPSLYQGKHRA